jgi:hypothetical protein
VLEKKKNVMNKPQQAKIHLKKNRRTTTFPRIRPNRPNSKKLEHSKISKTTNRVAKKHTHRRRFIFTEERTGAFASVFPTRTATTCCSAVTTHSLNKQAKKKKKKKKKKEEYNNNYEDEAALRRLIHHH